LIEFTSHIWLWVFIVAFFVAGLVVPVIAYILVGKTGGKVKEDTFECGQEIDFRPADVRILGAMRYFGYAVAFFVLDALSWILMASLGIFIEALNPLPVIIYIVIIAVGIYFFVKGLEEARKIE